MTTRTLSLLLVVVMVWAPLPGPVPASGPLLTSLAGQMLLRGSNEPVLPIPWLAYLDHRWWFLVVWIIRLAHRPALGFSRPKRKRCGSGRRSSSRRRRGQRRSRGKGGHSARKRRQVVGQLVRQMQPALQALVQEVTTDQGAAEAAQASPSPAEATAPQAELSQVCIPVDILVVTPDYSQTRCERCQGATKYKRSYYIHPQDINLDRPTLLQVYREVRKCQECGHFFAPELDFVAKNGRYTRRAKRKAIASVTEDGMPLSRVPRRMKRDFHLHRLSTASVHNWVHQEAEADLGEAEYTQWVTARFSGVVGIDEAHERDEKGRKQFLIVAVDPINDRTILFDLLDSNGTEAIVGFLEKLKALGIDPQVVITDMWKAYGAALAQVFPEAKHQLCVFHVIQGVMKHVNKAILTYRRALPEGTEQQKAVRKEVWDFRYPLLKGHRKLTARQEARVEDILRTHRGTVLAEAYYLKEAILALFRESQTKKAARYRRDMIVQRFGHLPELRKIISLIQGEQFEQMIIYLDYENLDKTNNDAERTNRVYRKGEKGRYRARTTRTRRNYVKLQARQRNQGSAHRRDRLKRKGSQTVPLAARIDQVAEQVARELTA